jgi:hypothetical protein
MAKASGLGWTTCSLDDSGGSVVTIINDVTNLQFATPRAVQDVTGIDRSAFERILNLADFSGTLNGVFNASASQAHTTLKTVGSASPVSRTLTLTVGGVTLAEEVHVTDYALTRAADGAFTWSAPFVLANGTFTAWA